jgi:hypothetical protein
MSVYSRTPTAAQRHKQIADGAQDTLQHTHVSFKFVGSSRNVSILYDFARLYRSPTHSFSCSNKQPGRVCLVQGSSRGGNVDTILDFADHYLSSLRMDIILFALLTQGIV